MREIPILFSNPMVQAILAGRKTQTRRQIKPRSYITDIVDGIPYEMTEDDSQPIKCPYGEVGDVLWVKETTCWVMLDHAHDLLEGAKEKNQLVYKENVHPDWMKYAKEKYGYKWKPSIFMPKEAARIWLRITNVRVERLQDISESDAISEGVEKQFTPLFQEWRYKDYFNINSDWRSPISSFQSLWASINGEQSWNDNPWVWVVEFERIVK